MSTFELPTFSSPATPKLPRKSRPDYTWDYGFSQVSTTPAGPPPSGRSLLTHDTSGMEESSDCRSSPQSKGHISEDHGLKASTTDLLLKYSPSKGFSPRKEPATAGSLRRSAIVEEPSRILQIIPAVLEDEPQCPLHGPDGIVDQIDELLESVHQDDLDENLSDDDLALSLSRCSQQICTIFHSLLTEHDSLRIGPSPDVDGSAKAAFVSSLLLTLHHPPLLKNGTEVPVPQILIDWLDRSHNPWAATVADVAASTPSPASDFRFWDTVCLLVLRGKLRQAAILLNRADFESAESARKDGQPHGYSLMQLRNIESVVKKAAELLEVCPAVRQGSWDLLSAEWNAYRQLIKQSLKDLVKFAEDRDDSVASPTSLQGSQLSHSQRARRAASRVPWTIYASLRTLYGIMLASESEIISCSQNWLEASLGLTIWWDGKSSHQTYLARLKASFREATRDDGEEEFQVNTNNAVEVALACVLEGNVDAVLRFCCKWSYPAADAVAEIANLGQWLNRSPLKGASNLIDLDPDDLAVLGQRTETSLTKDSVLKDYARTLVDYDKDGRPGWELALGLLRRLDNSELSRQEMSTLLRHLRPTSDLQIHNILSISTAYGLAEYGQEVTETYADQKLEQNAAIGIALVHYARAHRPQKIKALVELLTAASLVNSASYPSSQDLDVNLEAMLNAPADTLLQIADLDEEAARMLHVRLVGYAALRSYYDLRDKDGSVNQMISALLAIIEWTVRQSAIDPILCLFGELLYAVQARDAKLTPDQSFALLHVLEDISPEKGSEQLLQSALQTYQRRVSLPVPFELLSCMREGQSSFQLISRVVSESKASKSSHRSPDWRASLADGVEPGSLIRLLRVVLARQIAQGWVNETLASR